MKQLTFFVVLLLAIAARGHSPQPPYDGKSINELLPMLDSTNAATRIDAAEAIDWNLWLNSSRTNFIDAALIQQTASKATQLLRSDKDPIVRLASIDVLKELNPWTNTTPVLLSGLADKDDLVRVRVITALQRVCQQRGQHVGTNVVAALTGFLQKSTDSGVLCEAIRAAGDLGKEAESTIPFLEKLSGDANKEIRECADEALQKLRRSVARPIGSKA